MSPFSVTLPAGGGHVWLPRRDAWCDVSGVLLTSDAAGGRGRFEKSPSADGENAHVRPRARWTGGGSVSRT